MGTDNAADCNSAYYRADDKGKQSAFGICAGGKVQLAADKGCRAKMLNQHSFGQGRIVLSQAIYLAPG